ncbi:MAG TPA: hypothetical protein VJK08_02365 [Patescibacteria group bacterium]|nr:hypothetical protein [Patescibacteria group bacterium]
MIARLTKFGAYLILAAGILLAVVLFSFAIYFGFIYPGANQNGKVIVSIVFIIIAATTLIITISIFETIIETIKIEKKIDKVKDD